MKMKLLTHLMLLLISFSVFAQKGREPKTNMKSSFKERLAFKVEYFGELVLHPGGTIGIDFTITNHDWVTLHWSTDLGAYWHRWNNTSAFLKTTFGSRFSLGSAFADLNLGIGYMHSWAAGEIYQWSEVDVIMHANNRGSAHFMPNASFLLGWDGSRKNKLPLMVYFGPEVYLQYPFNHIFLPHVAAKIGFMYKIYQP